MWEIDRENKCWCSGPLSYFMNTTQNMQVY
jgi:hypothetical protein